MPLEIFWRLPLAGDGRSARVEGWERGDFSRVTPGPHVFARTGEPRDGFNYYDLVLQIGRAAELATFDGLWIQEQVGGEDPLIAAGSLAREVARLRLVPSLRPALLSAVYATKIANSFQRLTGGRLAWNVATDDEGQGRKWHGRSFSEPEQIARAGEFLDVARGFWNDAPFTYQGKYYEVVDGGFAPALQGESFPLVYLSGTSDDALALSARHADVHVFPFSPLPSLQEHIARLSRLAAERGRHVAIGVQVELLARHDGAEAQADAERERKVRRGPDLVGTYAEVAATLADYVAAGARTLVLSAFPHLEGAYAIGEHVLPLLRGQSPSVPVRPSVAPLENTAR